MACTCSHEPAPQKPNSKFRTALWIALFINATMFLVELIGGAYAHSSALWADSLDFFGDAVNYGVSLAVLGAGLYWRATVALEKRECAHCAKAARSPRRIGDWHWQ